MTEYRRAWLPGGTWFFTVNLAERQRNKLIVEKIYLLREAFERVGFRYPFRQEAFVIMPDDLHCIWTLPHGDTDFPIRWGHIKPQFSRGIEKGERISESWSARAERGIWQRRFWEHVIRDEGDYERHVDYIHYNPVKHGHVMRVADWPYSSFHRFVERGIYNLEWAADDNVRSL